jgi:hypothetical protein
MLLGIQIMSTEHIIFAGSLVHFGVTAILAAAGGACSLPPALHAPRCTRLCSE